MPEGEYVTLRSGAKMPLIGFGTFEVKNPYTISNAAEVGYKMFDTSSFYENEWILGDCLARSNRTDMFVVSKAWNDIVYDGPAAVIYQVAKSLQDLRVECIDLYMIHWPVPGKFLQVYKVLEDLHSQGKIKDIGISNFTIEDYEELIAGGIKVLPSVVQFEVNPLLFRKKTISYFQSKGMHVMSYRGFAKAGACLQDADVVALAAKYVKTPSQILGRFLVQQKISHIPKSSDRTRMAENRDIFSFKLEDSEMELLGKKTDSGAFEIFKGHYLSRRVKDTHLEFKPPKPVQFTAE